jgi:murein DD-endopeptidase MepM/ murein hydrolase activator NlpD
MRLAIFLTLKMYKRSFFALPIILLILLTATPAFAQETAAPPTYVIQPGDSLGTIAVRFGVDLNDLISFNNISDPDQISPGDVLSIPGLAGITGIIQSIPLNFGDTLKGLSIIYNIPIEQIINLNHITSPTELFAGSELLIPISNGMANFGPTAMESKDVSLLETSVKLNTTADELIYLNGKSAIFDFSRYELIFSKTDDDIKEIVPISSQFEDFSISPFPLIQGETTEIFIKSKEPVKIEGFLDNNPLKFVEASPNSFYALQGIYALADPGPVFLALTLTKNDGTISKLEQSILLVPGNYQKDAPLIVEPAMIDPSVTVPENDFVKSLTAPFTPEKYWQGIFTSPAYYQEYNSLFGNRRTYNDDPTVTFHTGVDFAGGVSLPITAPAAGKVVFAGPLTVRGNAIFIDHGQGIFSGFFHQSKLFVKEGDFVTLGQIIGEVGNTGRVNNANDFPGAGAHLHWELWVNGIQVNPLTWLKNEYP